MVFTNASATSFGSCRSSSRHLQWLRENEKTAAQSLLLIRANGEDDRLTLRKSDESLVLFPHNQVASFENEDPNPETSVDGAYPLWGHNGKLDGARYRGSLPQAHTDAEVLGDH